MNGRAVFIWIGLGVASLWSVALAAAPEALAPGAQLLESRRYEEAVKFFTGNAAQNPRDADAALYLGRAYLGLHQLDTAVKWLEKAAELAPGSSEKHQWLGRGYGEAAQAASMLSAPGLAHKAKAEFDKAVALDPANLDARDDLISYYLEAPGFLGGSVEEARKQAAEIRKRDGLRGHQAMAGILMHEKDLAGAERELQQAVQEAPSNVRARQSLGLFYANAARWNEAFETFEGLLKTDLRNYAALYQVGRTGAVSGQRLDRAEDCLKQYLAHSPSAQEPPLANAQLPARHGLREEGRQGPSPR